MNRTVRWIVVIGLLAGHVAVAGAVRAANVTDIGAPTATTPLGAFGGVAYVQYDGIVEGQTSTGTYRVPYRITAPSDRDAGNHSVLLEPPHFAQGTGALNIHYGPGFVLGNGFIHASVGYSTTPLGPRMRILDPSVPGVFINGGFADGQGRTDDEIIVDFAKTLTTDPDAVAIAHVERRYITGFSDSSVPVLRILDSGRGAGVFDLAVPFTAHERDQNVDPQGLLDAGRYSGKLIIVNSEFESSRSFIDRGAHPGQYRLYEVAGTPHVPDPLVPFLSNRTTPATYHHALRSHFLQGNRWVTDGTLPVPSTHIPVAGKKADAIGNALTVRTATGQPAPRLPIVELGEARYMPGFTGTYKHVRTIAELGYADHAAYLAAFDTALAAYEGAGYITSDEAALMHDRASLCPPLTFTETYRDHYEEFVANQPC